MTKDSIVRQVIDLQAQAERLIRTGGNMPEIEAFALYNEEIKRYLLAHITDEFVLEHIKTIPSLQIEEIETKSGIITFLIGLISGGSAAAYHEREKTDRSLKYIKEIANKYSSFEMMIRNSFEN